MSITRVLSGDDVVVGMGRMIGDEGWCFHIIDMAVLRSINAAGSETAYSRGSSSASRLPLPQGRTSRFLLTNPDVGCTSGMVSCRLLRIRLA